MRHQKQMSMDELLKDLQDQKTSQEESDAILLEELFNESFMKKHTSFASFNAFLEKGNFQASTLKDISHIHDELFDRHTARESDFTDWKSMLVKATIEFENARLNQG